MVGIIQEQHPDRASLFMQWKQMGWPIMVDSLDLLGAAAVPQTIFIDEAGVVRAIGARFDDLQAFVDRPPVQVDGPTAKPHAPSMEALKAGAEKGAADAMRAYADALILWQDQRRLGEAIGMYRRAMANGVDAPSTNFRLGVAYRKRFESPDRRHGDFRQAVDHWEAALAADPNQYIWRRRIQQYGPRLDKPYPFYDWVSRARRDILARGQTPHPLKAEPQGAEIARPARQFASAQPRRAEPDPQGRILRDHGALIHVETVVAPSTKRSQRVVRLHVLFRPNRRKKAHWNNEAGDLEVWLALPAGWEADHRVATAPTPDQSAVSAEDREVEFEVRYPTNATLGATRLNAYALYYVCEDVGGQCLYRRHDIPITVTVK